MSPPTPHRVVLYARDGCHLCDVARGTILAVRARHGFAFDEVDVETDDDLIHEYGFRVPVVLVDGLEVFEVEVPAEALTALVRM